MDLVMLGGTVLTMDAHGSLALRHSPYAVANSQQSAPTLR